MIAGDTFENLSLPSSDLAGKYMEGLTAICSQSVLKYHESECQSHINPYFLLLLWFFEVNQESFPS